EAQSRRSDQPHLQIRRDKRGLSPAGVRLGGARRDRVRLMADETIAEEQKCKSSSPARTASSAAQLQQPLSQRVIRFAAWFVTRRRPARLMPFATASLRSANPILRMIG